MAKTKIDEAGFLLLHADGKSDREMAEELGVRRATVQEFRDRRSLPPNRRIAQQKPKSPLPAVLDRAERIRLIEAVWKKIERKGLSR